MRHLFFWYFMGTIAVGLVSATIAAASYGRTRGTLPRSFLRFHAALSLLLLINAAFAYAQANLGDLDPTLFRLLSYLDSPMAVYLVMLALPVFIHELFAVPEAAARNKVFMLAVGLLYVAYNLFLFIAPAGGALERAARYALNHAAFLAVVAYSFVTGLRSYRTLIDGDPKRLCKRFLLLSGLFMPAIVHDKLRLSPMHFLPLPYCCLGVLFAGHFLKSDSLSAAAAAAAPDAETFQRYDLSRREREIVGLVLDGYSYQAIAQKLSISVNTVKAHIRNIYPKFGVANRYELMVLLRPKAGAAPTTQG